jgi:glucose-specific phosphotransferase system IIA component
VLSLGEVPDPVFAAEMVGPGVAIAPDPAGGPVTVVSPIDGRTVKIHPHAFVVLGDDGVGVLVHLGIDTVRLEGKGFEVLVEQGTSVKAGDPMVRWDPAAIEAQGLSAMVPVVAMDQPKGSVPPPPDGLRVATGDELFDVGG